MNVVNKFVVSLNLRRWWMLALIFGFSAKAVLADEAKKDACITDCVAIGEWQFDLGVGLGVRSNPLVNGKDNPLVLLPELSYYGRRAFLRNFDVGFSLVETDRHQLNLIVTPSYDQMYFNRWDPLNFSFSGGASTAPVGGVSGANFTSINFSGHYQDAAGSDPADPMKPSLSTPGQVTGDSQMPPASSPSSGSKLLEFAISGTVSAGAKIEINGTRIESNTQLQGAAGNTINIDISEGVLSIKNLSPGDHLVLISDDSVELNNIRGNVLGNTPDVANASRINVTTNAGKFVVVPDTAAAPKIQKSKLANDEVSQRRVSGLAGIEYSYFLPWMSLHLQALQEFTGIHGGHEYRVALLFPWDLNASKLAFTLGANYKSQKVLDYYYGVAAAEVPDVNLHYRVDDAGIETLVRLDWQKPLTKKWTLRARMQYLGLPSPTTASPLVAEDHVFSVFVGGVYHF